MMSERLHEESFEALAAAYFDEALDEAGLAELRSMLHADDRRVKRFAELAQLEQMIGSEIAYQHEAHRFGLSVSPNDNASASALAELASLYEDGLQDPMNFATWREEQANQARADRFAVWRNRMMIGGAIASLVAVVSVLAVVFIGGEASIVQTAEQVTDDQPAGPIDPVERNERVVATLTAANQALWATSSGNAAPAPGDTLHAGQRLVLAQGFAEITTEEGAVVILEAPATVELFDNDNAIRLHAGKLVGICETPSSKGFLVRTPHMDVIDLGTRFLVDANGSGHTDVHVFEGEVEVAKQPTGVRQAVERYEIKAGQAMRADIAAEITHLDPALHRIMPLAAKRLDEMSSDEASVLAHKPSAWWRHDRKDPQADVLGLVTFSQTHDGDAGSIQLDGRGCLDAGDLFGFEADQPFTLACWVRPARIENASIMGRIGHSTEQGLHGYDLYLSNGQLVFHLKNRFQNRTDPHQLIRVRSVPAIERDRWHHVAATYDGSRSASGVKLYLDGRLAESVVSDDTLGQASIHTDAPFRLGMRGIAQPNPDKPAPVGRPRDQSDPFVGTMGQAMVFDRAISPQTVAALYESRASRYRLTTDELR